MGSQICNWHLQFKSPRQASFQIPPLDTTPVKMSSNVFMIGRYFKNYIYIPHTCIHKCTMYSVYNVCIYIIYVIYIFHLPSWEMFIITPKLLPLWNPVFPKTATVSFIARALLTMHQHSSSKWWHLVPSPSTWADISHCLDQQKMVKVILCDFWG